MIIISKSILIKYGKLPSARLNEIASASAFFYARFVIPSEKLLQSFPSDLT